MRIPRKLAPITITEDERRQIEVANALERPVVVFIHGLWLLSSSWARWRELFEQAGYATVAPSWPDDPETVAAYYRAVQPFAVR